MLTWKERAQSAAADMRHSIGVAAPDLDCFRASCVHFNQLKPEAKGDDFEHTDLQELFEPIGCGMLPVELTYNNTILVPA